MTVAELTVVEFFGLQAVALAMFYLAGLGIRAYDHTWPLFGKLQYWAGMTALAGLPIYYGLTVLYPGLPRF